MRPKASLRRGRAPHTQTLVVCAGDSLTHGIMSANYVRMLEKELAPDGFQFVNAGVSMDLAYNVLQRLDGVIACNPDVVIVLAGSNDVAAHISEEWMKGYLRMQRPPVRPSIEWYGEIMARILGRLTTETTARVAVVGMPILTEDLAGDENRRIRDYNAVLRRVAAEAGVAVIPLFDATAAELPAEQAGPKFDGTHRVMNRAILSHWLLHTSWDKISEKNGLTLQTDHAHLNNRGAAIVASHIADYLRSIGG